MIKNSFFKHSILLFIFSLIFPPFAHAYAGPSVAIGIIIVAFTVIIAFFSSLFIKIFRACKYLFKFIFDLILKGKNKLKSKKVKKK